MNLNPMLLIDGYKLDHRRQYPHRTTKVYSNWTPRGSRIEGQKEVVFFGLQYFLSRYMHDQMQEHFFLQPRHKIEEQYKRRVDGYLGPNTVGTKHIATLHELGYVPLTFSALPEGTLCPLRVPMLVVENTHLDFSWLVNYFETLMSNVLWMPCTSATTAYRYRKLLNQWAEKTNKEMKGFVQWQGHDFSMRGMSSVDAAMVSGAGHLLSFTGTDTIPAIDFLEHYYADSQADLNGLIGGSVPASEHSVLCAGGEKNETDTFNHILDLYPNGVVSIVSDTWDLWNVLTNIVPSLKYKIMAREGKAVIRPDSGDPVKIVCGDPNANGPARKGVIELLWDTFGGTKTSSGHRQLDSHIGAIYGDAITYDRADKICEGLEKKGFASTNIVLGIGSYTYQYCTRDTNGFAMKATWAEVDGVGHDLFKKPVTDDGEKFSATGRLAVLRDGDRLVAIDRATPEQEKESLLQPVWENGVFLRRQSLGNIRRTLWNGAF